MGKRDSMMLKILFSFSLSFLLLCSFPLSGQDYEPFSGKFKRIREDSLFSLGPFYFLPRLQFRDIGYDSNVYFRPMDEETVGDYTAAFSPEIEVDFLLGRTLILHFTENPEYHHSLNEKERRNLTNSFSAGASLFVLGRFALSGNYSYSRRWARITAEFFSQTLTTSEGVEGSFYYESPSRITMGFSGRSTRVSYDDPFYDRQLARTVKGMSLDFYYRLFNESRLFLNFGYDDFQFGNTSSSWRNAQSRQVLCGIKFPLLGRIRGLLAFGYKKFDLLAAEEEAQAGMISRQSHLNYRIGRISFNLEYSRGIEFSYHESNAFFIADSFRIGAGYYISRSLRLDYDFRYGENNYPKTDRFFLPDGSIEEVKRRDIFRTHSAALVFRVGESTGLGLSINYVIHTSNHMHFGDRQRMFVGGYLTYDF